MNNYKLIINNPLFEIINKTLCLLIKKKLIINKKKYTISYITIKIKKIKGKTINKLVKNNKFLY
jgi:hypothetical protein